MRKKKSPCHIIFATECSFEQKKKNNLYDHLVIRSHNHWCFTLQESTPENNTAFEFGKDIAVWMSFRSEKIEKQEKNRCVCVCFFFCFITNIFITNKLRKVQEENRFAWLRKVFRCNIVTLVFSSSSKTMTRTSAYWKKVRENLTFIHITLSV